MARLIAICAVYKLFPVTMHCFACPVCEWAFRDWNNNILHWICFYKINNFAGLLLWCLNKFLFLKSAIIFYSSPPIPTEYCQGHCFAECIEGVRGEGSNAVTSLKVKLLETSEGIIYTWK